MHYKRIWCRINVYNPFSENWKKMIHDTVNVEFFELCETTPEVQCFLLSDILDKRHSVLHLWTLLVPYGFNAKIEPRSIWHIIDLKLCDQEGFTSRILIRDNWGADIVSHSLQRVVKGAERKKIPQVESTQVFWTDSCKVQGLVNQKKHMGGQKKDVNSTTHWRWTTIRTHWQLQCIELENSTEQFRTKWDRWPKDQILKEAVRLKNRPRRESGETQEERIHPGEQGRSNPYNQFSTTCQNSARMDRRRGWKCYLSSSSSSSWKHSDNWWTQTSVTAEATFSMFL